MLIRSKYSSPGSKYSSSSRIGNSCSSSVSTMKSRSSSKRGLVVKEVVVAGVVKEGLVIVP